MNDGVKIKVGLVIALIILAFPFWWNLIFAGPLPAVPDPKLSPKAKAAKTCIYPKDYMKRNHMQILDDWRSQVVRDSKRFMLVEPGQEERPIEMVIIKEVRDQVGQSLVEIPGIGAVREMLAPDDAPRPPSSKQRVYEMSLQNTCMECHSNKKDFCDSCHNYVEVAPFCWNCHIEPKENK